MQNKTEIAILTNQKPAADDFCNAKAAMSVKNIALTRYKAIGRKGIAGCSGSRADFRPVGIGLETRGEFRFG